VRALRPGEVVEVCKSALASAAALSRHAVTFSRTVLVELTQSVCLLCAVRAYSLFVQETQILSIQLTGNVNGVRHTFLFLAGGCQG
jgi:hypothetical protein